MSNTNRVSVPLASWLSAAGLPSGGASPVGQNNPAILHEFRLTAREKEIALLLLEGLKNEE
ncbi:MAG: hypothetical protein M1598_05215, partial [Actinobacteria bacterium]|nr:hypothetical protein [Actinomycetota bacterium]